MHFMVTCHHFFRITRIATTMAMIPITIPTIGRGEEVSGEGVVPVVPAGVDEVPARVDEIPDEDASTFSAPSAERSTSPSAA